MVYSPAETEGDPVALADFKSVARRDERRGWVRFPRVSARLLCLRQSNLQGRTAG